MQVSACEALARIAEGTPESAAQMVEEGMIGLIKQAMEVHPEEKQVQGRACDALTGIALGGPECAAQIVEKLRGQRLRASRKAPIQYSACAKRAHIFSSESSVWRGRPRTNLATWRRSFPLAIDGSPSAHHVAKVAKVSNAVARVGPQSRRLGTALRGCLRWRCHNFVHTSSDPGRSGGSVGAFFWQQPPNFCAMSKKCFLLTCGPTYFQLFNPIALPSALANLVLKVVMCVGRSVGENTGVNTFSAASTSW